MSESTVNIAGVEKVPMAVYPLNSSAKLDQEPNPFEKSFSTTINDNKLILPPVAAITSPSPILPTTSNSSVIGGGILPKEVTNQLTWDTLRTGPLSPSMLQEPINHSNTTTFVSPNNRKRSTSQTESIKRKSTEKDTEDDEKRKNFLERNRIAALKCRQRKKQWLNNLQAKVEFLTSDNERLQIQSESLKQEIINLKTLLLAHKDCQANGFNVNKSGLLLTTDQQQQPMMTSGSSTVIR